MQPLTVITQGPQAKKKSSLCSEKQPVGFGCNIVGSKRVDCQFMIAHPFFPFLLTIKRDPPSLSNPELAVSMMQLQCHQGKLLANTNGLKWFYISLFTYLAVPAFN